MAGSVDTFFEEEPDRLVIKTNDLKMLPVTLTIGNEEQTRDMIVLESDDLTGRFVDGYSYRFSPSRKRNSKWQMWLRECSKNLGRSLDKPKDIVGRFYEVQLEVWSWGEGMESTVPVIVKEFSNEEEAKKRATEISGGAATTSTSAEMEYVVDLLDGKTYNEALQVVVADPNVSQDQELVAQIVSREYMNDLIDRELLEIDEDGVYHRFAGI